MSLNHRPFTSVVSSGLVDPGDRFVSLLHCFETFVTVPLGSVLLRPVFIFISFTAHFLLMLQYQSDASYWTKASSPSQATGSKRRAYGSKCAKMVACGENAYADSESPGVSVPGSRNDMNSFGVVFRRRRCSGIIKCDTDLSQAMK